VGEGSRDVRLDAGLRPGVTRVEVVPRSESPQLGRAFGAANLGPGLSVWERPPGSSALAEPTTFSCGRPFGATMRSGELTIPAAVFAESCATLDSAVIAVSADSWEVRTEGKGEPSIGEVSRSRASSSSTRSLVCGHVEEERRAWYGSQ